MRCVRALLVPAAATARTTSRVRSRRPDGIFGDMSASPPAPRFLPLRFERRAAEVMRARAETLRDELAARRSVRAFSAEPIPPGVLDACLACAGSAPSGANRQPWTFVVVTDPEVKRAIRLAAEEEERRNYEGRMDAEWRAALAPLGTDWEKPFLETAPALVVVFRHAYGCEPGPWSVSSAGADTHQNYYTTESAGIACGFFIAALHVAGLATLTHTPSPMGFLARVLQRPANERAFLLLPVGYPAEGCTVPDIARKPLEQFVVRV